MKRYQSEHFCLLVYAQDHCDEKDELTLKRNLAP
jgi:hypothetical protein